MDTQHPLQPLSKKEPETKIIQANTINWKKNLFFIWLCQLLVISGFSSALPFIPVYIRDNWNITGEHELGIWMSAFYFFGMLSFCIFTPLWGVLADRYGRKLMLLRACYVDAILFPCFLLAPNPTMLIFCRFVTSAFTGTVSAAQTLIVTTTPQEHHGFALGTLGTAVWSGNLIGFSLGGLIVHYWGFKAAFWGCGLMYLIGGILAHVFIKDDFKRTPAAKAEKPGQPLSWMTTAVALIFFLIVLNAMGRRFDEPYVAVMIEKIHGPLNTAFHTGWISAVAAVGGIISGMVIGRLCDRYSARRIAIPALAFAGVTMFLQAAAGSLLGYSVFRFFNYIAAGGLETVMLSILSKISPRSCQGSVFGWASAIRMVGILVSSVLSGLIIYNWGVRSVYTAAGVIFIVTIPIVWYTIKYIHRNGWKYI